MGHSQEVPKIEQIRMSSFDWDRKGPPRPGSGATDHPCGIVRPFVHETDAEKARRSKAYRDAAKAKGEAIRRAELKQRFIEMGIELPEHMRDEIQRSFANFERPSPQLQSPSPPLSRAPADSAAQDQRPA